MAEENSEIEDLETGTPGYREPDIPALDPQEMEDEHQRLREALDARALELWPTDSESERIEKVNNQLLEWGTWSGDRLQSYTDGAYAARGTDEDNDSFSLWRAVYPESKVYSLPGVYDDYASYQDFLESYQIQQSAEAIAEEEGISSEEAPKGCHSTRNDRCLR